MAAPKLTYEQRVNRYVKIAREYAEKGPQTLAKELGLSRQRVYQIVCTLRKKGIYIPNLRKKDISAIEAAARILLKK